MAKLSKAVETEIKAGILEHFAVKENNDAKACAEGIATDYGSSLKWGLTLIEKLTTDGYLERTVTARGIVKIRTTTEGKKLAKQIRKDLEAAG